MVKVRCGGHSLALLVASIARELGCHCLRSSHIQGIQYLQCFSSGEGITVETDIILDKDVSLPVSHDLSEASACTRLGPALIAQSNWPSNACLASSARMYTLCVPPRMR